MPDPADVELEELRREVDRLDNAMVDLLVDRLQAVRAIAGLKQRVAAGQPAIRPGREAVILRRLIERAGERFPAGTLVRMWRELLAATTRAQAPLVVAACVPAGQPELWDMARDHFGSQSPIRRTTSTSQALRLLADRSVQLAVLPLPDEHDPWWSSLLDTSVRPLRVVARLPFAPAAAYPEGSGAYVVGRHRAGPVRGRRQSAGDRDRRRGRPRPAARSPGGSRFDAQLARDPPRRGNRPALHLLALDGFLPAHEPRLAHALNGAREHVLRSAWLGSYARPLPAGG